LPAIDRIALVANTGSGSGGAEEVEARLREGSPRLRAFPPDRAAEAARSGCDRLVIAGGDGSIAPAASAAGRAGIPVAVIPVGTANDFAAATELPDDPAAGVRLALEGERTRAIDLGWLDERPFVNVVSAGLPPAAARRAAGLKGRLGPLAYMVGAVWAGLRARPVECAVACDGSPVFGGSAWQVTVGCSGAFGAGSSVGGGPEDRRLRLVVVPAGSRAALLLRAHGLRRGTVARQAGVIAHECRSVDLELPAGTELNVDGEVVESGPAGLRIEPRAFQLVVG
jgi:diacylglycerol kinase family enzyme